MRDNILILSKLANISIKESKFLIDLIIKTFNYKLLCP